MNVINNRVVSIRKEDGTWTNLQPFKTLSMGDIFKLYEEDGTLTDEGMNTEVCVCTSEVTSTEDGVLGVQCEPFVGNSEA